MKFVLLILAVLALLWLLRSSLSRARGSRTDAPSASPKAMLRCAHCGTHLASDLALPGRGGVFCDAAHRAAYEQAHPET
ncbi:MAG: PP0621 family protein [Rhizobacter sp.]